MSTLRPNPLARLREAVQAHKDMTTAIEEQASKAAELHKKQQESGVKK